MLSITDHDLLLIEPAVFTLAAAGATALFTSTDADVSGNALESATADFATQEIDENHVAVVNGVAVEIISRVQATQLEISLPRADGADPTIAPGDGTGLTLTVLSFARLINQAKTWVLLALGIDPDHATQPLDEDAILNPELIERAIALVTIERAFSLAAAIASPADPTLNSLATLYSRLAASTMRQTVCVIDLNGDGQADATRRLDVVTFVRN